MGAAIVMPFADTEAMQEHLAVISAKVAPGARAALILDRAGSHTTTHLAMPENIVPIFLPSRSPELNPQENIWQFIRHNWLSNRVFETYEAIVDAACDAWNRLTAMPEKIKSIGLRARAHCGHKIGRAHV